MRKLRLSSSEIKLRASKTLLLAEVVFFRRSVGVLEGNAALFSNGFAARVLYERLASVLPWPTKGVWLLLDVEGVTGRAVRLLQWSLEGSGEPPAPLLLSHQQARVGGFTRTPALTQVVQLMDKQRTVWLVESHWLGV